MPIHTLPLHYITYIGRIGKKRRDGVAEGTFQSVERAVAQGPENGAVKNS
jgi:hypothetical protein